MQQTRLNTFQMECELKNWWLWFYIIQKIEYIEESRIFFVEISSKLSAMNPKNTQYLNYFISGWFLLFRDDLGDKTITFPANYCNTFAVVWSINIHMRQFDMVCPFKKSLHSISKKISYFWKRFVFTPFIFQI